MYSRSFHLSLEDEYPLTLSRLQGQDTLSEGYAFDLTAHPTEPRTRFWSSLKDRDVVLRLGRTQAEAIYYQGRIESLTRQAPETYVLRITSRLTRLQGAPRTQVPPTESKAFPQVLKTWLAARGHTLSEEDYLPPIEFTGPLLQYQETDWDFLHRLLSQSPFFFQSHDTAKQRQLALSQTPFSETPLKASFHPDTAHIFLKEPRFRQRLKTVQNVEVHQFDPQYETRTERVGGPGWSVSLDPTWKHPQLDSRDSDLISHPPLQTARSRLYRQNLGHNTLEAKTPHTLRTGQPLEVDGKRYLLTHQTFDLTPGQFESQLTLSPLKDYYVSPIEPPFPTLTGIHAATVQQVKNGQIWLTYEWDPLKTPQAVPFAESLASDGFGSLHLPRSGDTVLVSFQGHQPLVIGTCLEKNLFPPETEGWQNGSHLSFSPTQVTLKADTLSFQSPQAKRTTHTLHAQTNNFSLQGKTLILKADNLHFVCGQSRISLNASGILFEADKILWDEPPSPPPKPLVLDYVPHGQPSTLQRTQLVSGNPLDIPLHTGLRRFAGRKVPLEIISLNDQPTDHPLITVDPESLPNQILHKPGHPYHQHPRVRCGYLQPFNFVYAKGAVPQDPLDPDILDYYHQHGGLVPIFIHGFNVPAFYKTNLSQENITLPRYWSGIKIFPMVERDPVHPFALPPSFDYSPTAFEELPFVCTWLRNHIQAHQQFPQTPDLPFEETVDSKVSRYNGFGQLLWLLWIEDSLNRATQQFRPSLSDPTLDYRHYLRVLGFFWDSETPPYFGLAQHRAEEIAPWLFAVFKQLTQAGLTPLPITHSLGARVLLCTLDLWAEFKQPPLDHAFLFQPAVLANALSTQPPDKNLPYGLRERYPHAMDAIQKLTIFYSRQDGVLGPTSFHESLYGSLGGVFHLQAEMEKWRTLDKLLDELKHEAELGPFGSIEKQVKLMEKIRDLYETEIAQAMGWNGPDLRDEAVYNWIFKDKRIILADMTRYSHGHSYMKMPGDPSDPNSVMVMGYMKYFFSKRFGALKKFGSYDPEKFLEFGPDGNPKQKA